MSTLDVTVMLVASDAAPLLPTVLAHLEQQRFPAARYEVLVADAASTDGSAEVVKRYAQGAPMRVRVVHGPSTSPLRAANVGLHAAAGRWLLMLDAALLASPEWITHHVAAQERAGGAACVAGRVGVHPQMSPSAFTRWSLWPRPFPKRPGAAAFTLCNAANLSLPRATAASHGGFDVRFLDLDCAAEELAFRLGFAGVPVEFDPEATAYTWRPTTFGEERVRCYREGYSARLLGELTRQQDVAAQFGLRRGGLNWMMDQALLSFYLRTANEVREGAPGLRAMYARVLQHKRMRGYADAQRQRPPKYPIER